MDYTVIIDSDLSEFTKQVIELIAAGWEPQGGVSISVSESDDYRYVYYAQSLIKRPRGAVKA